jgi:hypothetical protein
LWKIKLVDDGDKIVEVGFGVIEEVDEEVEWLLIVLVVVFVVDDVDADEVLVLVVDVSGVSELVPEEPSESP